MKPPLRNRDLGDEHAEQGALWTEPKPRRCPRCRARGWWPEPGMRCPQCAGTKTIEEYDPATSEWPAGY